MTHKLIHTPDYLLVVDDSGTRIAHLPLNGSPILEGVALLSPLEQEDDVEKDEIIQSLSQSKMPIGFECEENTFFATNAFSSDITLTLEGLQDTVLKGIKTTTNSQGQTVWVGKYIY